MLTLPRPLDVPFTDTSAEALRLSLDHGRIAPLAARRIDVPTVAAPTDTESTLAEAAPHLKVGGQAVLGRQISNSTPWVAASSG